MANYINTTDNTWPHSETAIRAAFPMTSFPSPFVPPDDYKVVFPAPAPSFDPITQSCREIAPVLTNKGHYEQAWEVVDLDPEIAAANQARHNEQHNSVVWSKISNIERESLMPRALRDLIPADHPAYQKVQAINQQIADLKATLL